LLSNKCFHKENIKKVKTLLKINQYPVDFNNTHINQRLRYILSNRRINNSYTKSPTNLTIPLPYKHGFYKQCKKSLNKLGVNVITLINNKLDIVKLGKDKVDKNEKTGVVYKFNCNSCDSCYVGETKRKLLDRIKEHKKPSKKIESVINKDYQTNPGHSFDFDKTKILDQESSFSKRRISEMIYIKSSNNTLNKKEDTLYLPNTYTPICERLAKICK